MTRTFYFLNIFCFYFFKLIVNLFLTDSKLILRLWTGNYIFTVTCMQIRAYILRIYTYRQRIELKIRLLVCRAVHHLGPDYLTYLVSPQSHTRSLRPAGQCQLTIPRNHVVGGLSRWRDRRCGTIDPLLLQTLAQWQHLKCAKDTSSPNSYVSRWSDT